MDLFKDVRKTTMNLENYNANKKIAKAYLQTCEDQLPYFSADNLIKHLPNICHNMGQLIACNELEFTFVKSKLSKAVCAAGCCEQKVLDVIEKNLTLGMSCYGAAMFFRIENFKKLIKHYESEPSDLKQKSI